MTVRVQDYIGKKVYMIGIGGSSMSGLAMLLKDLGYEVSGADNDRTKKTAHLEELGIPVDIGHDPEKVEGKDLIVYSAAIHEDNPQMRRARDLGLPRLERAELLGQLMLGYRDVICVSGTHGKTTTTAMLSQVLVECGQEPTVHIGGELPAIGGSTLLGKQDVFVAEACEYSRSFMQFHPTVGVILNIDEDHLDYYKDIDEIESAFADFAALTPADRGCLVGWGDDPRVRRVLENSGRKHRLYGISPANELRAEDISYDELGRPHFTATLFGHQLCEVDLSVSGEKNLLDALAVIGVAEMLQLPMSRVAQVLSEYRGAKRRFELTSETDGVKVYTDYAHNPAEISTAISIAKHQPHHTLWAVWQPHTYTRTKTLIRQFLKETFTEADRLLVTDICAARETDPGDISSEMLIEPLRENGCDAHLTPTFDDAERYLREHWQKGDLVITLGCGDIYRLNDQIARHGDTGSKKKD